MAQQLDATTGKLEHLLTLDGLPASLYADLFTKAESFMHPTTGRIMRRPLLQGKLVVNAFFEPSTRTRLSFEIAAKSLGAEVANFAVAQSSYLSKGESFEDTVRVLAALGANVIVLRHGGNQLGEIVDLVSEVSPDIVVINGGNGGNAHPSQALLDTWTVQRRCGTIKGLRVTIIGDILHSRVARSLAHAFGTLGVACVRVSGPPHLMVSTKEAHQLGVEVVAEVDDAVTGVDVIVCLRIQYERITDQTKSVPQDYRGKYCIDSRRLALAAPEAVVLHPGPVNRDIEISAQVADGSHSCILAQVTNGVAMRMAIMQVLLADK